MKKSKFTEEQIAFALKQAESGTRVEEVCRKNNGHPIHSPMQLATRRLLLRDFTDRDAVAFAAYHADPRSRALYGPDEGGSERATELVELFQTWALGRPRSKFQFAVVLRSGDLIGCAGLRMEDASAGTAELGLELDPEYWGRFGYAIEIATVLLDFGFSDLDLCSVQGRILDANMRTVRLAEAMGATPLKGSTPDGVAARGWRQFHWHISREQWLAPMSTRRGLRRDLALRYRRNVTDA